MSFRSSFVPDPIERVELFRIELSTVKGKKIVKIYGQIFNRKRQSPYFIKHRTKQNVGRFYCDYWQFSKSYTDETKKIQIKNIKIQYWKWEFFTFCYKRHSRKYIRHLMREFIPCRFSFHSIAFILLSNFKHKQNRKFMTTRFLFVYWWTRIQ